MSFYFTADLDLGPGVGQWTLRGEPASNGHPDLCDVVALKDGKEMQRWPNRIPPGNEHLHPYSLECLYDTTLIKEEP